MDFVICGQSQVRNFYVKLSYLAAGRSLIFEKTDKLMLSIFSTYSKVN